MGRKKLILFAAIPILIGAGYLLYVFLFVDYYVLDMFHLGEVTVKLEAEAAWEVSQGVFISASGGNCHIPRTFVGTTSAVDELKFS